MILGEADTFHEKVIEQTMQELLASGTDTHNKKDNESEGIEKI